MLSSRVKVTFGLRASGLLFNIDLSRISTSLLSMILLGIIRLVVGDLFHVHVHCNYIINYFTLHIICFLLKISRKQLVNSKIFYDEIQNAIRYVDKSLINLHCFINLTNDITNKGNLFCNSGYVLFKNIKAKSHKILI